MNKKNLNCLDGMIKNITDLLCSAYWKGYKAGHSSKNLKESVDTAYQCGTNIAWRYAQKILEMSMKELDDCKFNTSIYPTGKDVILHTNPNRAIELVKKYEETIDKNNLHVGDEVIIDNRGIYGVVIQCTRNGNMVLLNDGNTIWFDNDENYIVKTGKRYEIPEILEQLRRETNDFI